MHDPGSMDSNQFISHDEIMQTLEQAPSEAGNRERVREILDKASGFGGLTHREAAVLLNVESPEVMEEVFALARRIKEHIYGRRIVMFAPLYMSDYCVNRCTYCGYNHDNCIARKRLNQEELAQEVRVLQSLGHKRLALETGEDPVNCPIEYVLESIRYYLLPEI